MPVASVADVQAAAYESLTQLQALATQPLRVFRNSCPLLIARAGVYCK
jgi:hypothetical protein